MIVINFFEVRMFCNREGIVHQCMQIFRHINQVRLFVFIPTILITLAGCGSFLPSSGPSATRVNHASDSNCFKDIQIIELTEGVVQKLILFQKQNLFSETFAERVVSTQEIGAGDVIEVSIWEVPPALFGGVIIDQSSGSGAAQMTRLPEQMVNLDGTINIPFAGQVPVAGLSTQQVEANIKRSLRGKANQPQVLVRMVHNNTANVTVVGEVAASLRVPLTARRERLLDALAAAGGVRQPVNKMTLQLTRGSRAEALPLETIIRDPRQNIILRPDDVITLLFQPLSFTALGAVGKNEEISFEAQGISLAQALGRIGGLQDSRADAQGVFIFRFELPKLFGKNGNAIAAGFDGLIPVIYRVNLKDPASFFLAQHFAMQNKDILYVSNASSSDLQHFLSLVVSVVYPVVHVIDALP